MTPSSFPLLPRPLSLVTPVPNLSFVFLLRLVLILTPFTISHLIYAEGVAEKSSSPSSTSSASTVWQSPQAFIAPSPLLYKINQKQTECIYSFFSKNDSVTFSVFVVEAFMRGDPVAKVVFEGPVAGLLEEEGGLKKAGIKTKIWNGNGNNKNGHANGDGDGDGGSANSGKDGDDGEAKNEYNKHSKYYQKSENALGRRIQTSLKNHWPTLQSHDKLQRFDKRIGVLHRTLKIDWTHAGESEDKVAAREEVKEREVQTFNEREKSGSSNNDNRNNIDNHIQTITQEKIQPYQETRSIKLSGYYRLCTTADFHPLLVEMDMRSKSELGGLDSQTGHVYEWAVKERMEQDSWIDGVMDDYDDDDIDNNRSKNNKNSKDEEILQNQIKDQDLHATKSQLKQLNQMVAEMKTSLKDSVYRIKSHEAEAKRNYDGMVWSGKVETLLYLAVTGLQVYTVRRWLLTNSVLGR